MILVIGGAYQGKKDYVAENFSDRFDKDNVFYDFHKYAFDLVKDGIDPLEFVKENLNDFKEKIIICDDVSCGIVPIDEVERRFREQLGRTLVLISKNSQEVHRVFAGIGARIK